MQAVSAEEIDDYLGGVEEPKRGTLETLRATIVEVVPDAEQGISYGMPALPAAWHDDRRLRHVEGPPPSYLPHSGSVLGELAGDLSGYTPTTAARFCDSSRPKEPRVNDLGRQMPVPARRHGSRRVIHETSYSRQTQGPPRTGQMFVEARIREARAA